MSGSGSGLDFPTLTLFLAEKDVECPGAESLYAIAEVRGCLNPNSLSDENARCLFSTIPV